MQGRRAQFLRYYDDFEEKGFDGYVKVVFKKGIPINVVNHKDDILAEFDS